MQSLCRFDMCELAAQLISAEFNAPAFCEVDGKTGDYEKARYFYTYFCHTHLNASFRLIRKTMPVYKYPKTVYQVFKRAYERRKENENKFLLQFIKQEFEKKIQEYKTRDFMIRGEGKQIYLFS